MGQSEEQIQESFAAFFHQQWADWMTYLFSETILEDDLYAINENQVEKWTRQMNTPYSELPENEKDIGREQVEKFMTFMAGMSP